MKEYTRLRIEFIEGFNDNETAAEVEFNIEDSMDIYELFTKMKKAAIAFGFSVDLVEEVFGEDYIWVIEIKKIK